jgi:uncharacterized membrane-anchored protein YitT (DUF2179 family)
MILEEQELFLCVDSAMTDAGAAGILLLINGKLTFGKVKFVVPICINLPLLLISLFNFNVLIKIPCHDMASLSTVHA